MKRRRAGFSLLELLTVIVITGIVSVLLLAGYSKLRSRAQRAQCSANLHSLYLAAESALQQNGSWPQIPRNSASTGTTDYARAWIDTLAPYGPTAKSWICPTIQNLLGNPDYLKPENTRIDYVPMPFDDKPTTPHQWPRQPWFVEAGDVHGHGNLIIFTDGSIGDLSSAVAAGSGPAP
jgi:prepilin-type N-terminal cleavage/methylation domain-containing protein